ncbi:hypothetical protein C1J01_42170, partial [Nonomuraea aridisoli]
GTDGLGRRYSTGHERGTSFVRTWRFNTEPTLVIYLHRIWDATDLADHGNLPAPAPATRWDAVLLLS